MALRRFRYRMQHNWFTALQMGLLVPIFNQEVTPGDTWSGRSTALVRMAPLELPTMMQASININFFFVPQ